MRAKRCSLILSSLLTATATVVARAEPTSQASNEAAALGAPERPERRLSITASPLSLVLPMAELTAEVRAQKKVGLALTAGAGWLTQSSTALKTHLALYELAAQGRYYVLGDFRHGMQLGLEVGYFHVASPFKSQIAIASDALTLAPFVGYKYTSAAGFTVETQLGYQRLWARGTANEVTASSAVSTVLFHLHLGWSF